MTSIKKHPQWSLCLLGLATLVVFAVFFSACGGSAAMTTANTGSSAAMPVHSAQGIGVRSREVQLVDKPFPRIAILLSNT